MIIYLLFFSGVSQTPNYTDLLRAGGVVRIRLVPSLIFSLKTYTVNDVFLCLPDFGGTEK